MRAGICVSWYAWGWLKLEGVVTPTPVSLAASKRAVCFALPDCYDSGKADSLQRMGWQGAAAQPDAVALEAWNVSCSASKPQKLLCPDWSLAQPLCPCGCVALRKRNRKVFG